MGVPPKRYISTFAGSGAFDRAIRRVFRDAQCLCYVENELTAALRLAARMEEGRLDQAPVWSDITTFPGGQFSGRVDLVVGSFPCQDLSLAGKRGGIHAARSGLFFSLMDVVRSVGSRYLVMENSAGIFDGRALDAVHGELAASGLDAVWGSLSAGDVGASHGRDRWWCLAWNPALLADSGRRSDEQRRRPGNAPRSSGSAQGEAQERQWGGDADRGPCGRDDGQVADADSGRCSRWSERNGGSVGPELQAPQRHDAERCDPAVAIPASHGRREGRAESAGQQGRPDAALGGSPLAFSERQRRALSAPGQLSAEQEPAGPVYRLPEHPPGWRGEDERWRAVLDVYPELAPATESVLRRVADVGAGDDRLDLCLCSRNDRIRLVGNAVDTRAAEWAIRLLWYRAFGAWL